MQTVDYIKKVAETYKQGRATEHSYRGFLKDLIESIVTDIVATNEPTRSDCGAPDYIITRKDLPIGYIEAKDVDKNLDNKGYTEQFNRYKASLNNLIITDYLEFRFYKDGEKTTTCKIGHIENGKVVANQENFQTFIELIKSFCSYQGQSIKSASKLAKIMAGKAKLLSNIINNALESKDDTYENNSLHTQLKAFQKILINDIKPAEFADVYAQTIAYGMFAARLNDDTQDSFSRQEACECIPKSNPFLRRLFGYIAGPEIDDRIKWVVDDLVDVFVVADLHNILKDFGKTTKTQDPIIHFYETFLSEYDQSLRKSRGVWYTPQPIVNFIVRAVDEILKKDFELKDGLADISKIKVKVENKGKDKHKIEEQEIHRVQVLDPATGTGTFLAEVIRQIHEQYSSTQGMWNGYVDNHLLPRIQGFELLMASYAMAHLKLDLVLKETGYKPTTNNRLKVYLTNSLEEPHPDEGTLFASWLSQEANEANNIKKNSPIMVVLGNPPYSGESSNKGKWIMNLMDAYKKEPTGGALQERNPKWINNDYVKFIRYAEQFIEKNNSGVLAYINSNSFLENPTFRGMRWHLLNTFDKIYIIDLHGNSRIRETCPDGSNDENVFDIKEGVSINIFVKTTEKKKNKLADVYHCDLYGQREYKYVNISENSLTSIKFNKLEYMKPYYFFSPKDLSLQEDYDENFSMHELFIVNSMGVVSAKDSILINKDINDLRKNIEKEYNIISDDSFIKPILYRPFDKKHIYFDNKYVERTREKVMKNFINKQNLGLIAKRGLVQVESMPIFITNNITESRSWSCAGMQGGDYVFPLYTYEDVDNSKRHNFNNEIITKFAEGLKIKFVAEKEENTQNTFAPIDVLDYIYAVLHSPKYRETYKEFLKIDFPKVPYPTNVKKFWHLVELGSQIRSIHLLESNQLSTLKIGYPKEGNNIIEKPIYENERVYINQDQYFDNVPEIAWNFYIGGYQPAQKWLKDRKDQELAFNDIRHYQNIINALCLTNQLMQQIDKVLV